MKTFFWLPANDENGYPQNACVTATQTLRSCVLIVELLK